MTEIGYVIQPGESIPGAALRVKDAVDDIWTQLIDRTWRLTEYRGAPWDGHPIPASVLSERHGPLTVTAVREPEPAAPVHLRVPSTSGSACDSDLWQDPEEENPDLWPQSTSVRDKVTCEACRATFTAPVDVSPLLDLVRQLREAAQGLGYSEGVGQRTDIDAKKADALFDRIAALVAQQPVQARSATNQWLWRHECGWTRSADVLPDPDDCPSCGDNAPGPWRPLLVGGDPTPEPRCSACGSVNPPGGCNIHCPTILVAQVMDLLGVEQRILVMPMLVNRLKAIEVAEGQRDEARAEAERLDAEAERVTDELVGARDEVGRLKAFMAADMGAGWLKLFLTRHDADQPAQSHPLVLSLPEQPSWARRVTTASKGGAITEWRLEGRDSEFTDGVDPYPWLSSEGRNNWRGLLLIGAVTVLPREPRTWPKLDSAPEDLMRFKGASGKVWRRGDRDITLWCWEDDAGALRGFRTFAEIQHEDGPLTEVFDEPDAAA